jgi:tRNA pseudouridine38-40 synthase
VPTYRLKIEYNGTAFSGWQTQPGASTVQGALEKAAAIALGHSVSIQGAARTDAGVHALGQVASFDSPIDIEPIRLRHSLTALCRPDVAVIEAAVAPDRFNARFDSIGKHYRYCILMRSSPSPFLRNTSHRVAVNLDLNEMNRAAALFLGRHDFRGFRASDCGRLDTVREISSIAVSMCGADLVAVDVKGNAFLKNMVRIISGTLIEVGRGRIGIDVVSQALQTGDRRLAGPTAPACGLTLVEVFYPQGWLRSRP